ncbi:MAG: efflux RND transporter permease subunit, partial [Verrucomicrobiota bacterium]
MRLGEDPKIAAPKGTHEVGVVVIFGIITTAVAFTPMLGLSGVSGKIWPNIPLIVIPTLLFSLLQSKLILPAHLSYLPAYDPNKEPGPILRIQRLFSRGLESFVDRFYRPALRICLHARYVVLCSFIAVFLIVASLVGLGWIKFQFFPNVEGDVISAKLEMARGVPFEATQRAVRQLETAAQQIRDEYRDNEGNSIVRHMLTSDGTQPFVSGNAMGLEGTPTGSHLGEITMELSPAATRDLSVDDLVDIWRDLAGPVPGAVQLTFQAETAAGGNAIDLELTGTNLDHLEAAAEEIKAALATYPGVIDIASSNRAGNQELKLDILPQAEALNLRLSDVANQVRQGFFGDEVQRLQRGRDEVKVFVRYPREERRSIAQLDTMKIRTQSGDEVPFSEVAVASVGRAESSIQRADRRRSITITADVVQEKTNANEVVAAITSKGLEDASRAEKRVQSSQLAERFPDQLAPEKPVGILTEITKQYPDLKYSFQGEQKDQNQSVQEMGQKAILALLFMYVLMAIPLRSYTQPLIIMSVVPFGLVGAVLGHVIMGFNLSIMSMCGIVALAGVVVNDSLVLVDYVNREVARGKTILEAAWEAGAVRFRPILLTSLTTFAGLTPMLLETDLQARFLIPMAVSLAFGILFATGITLILIPSLYLIQNDVHRLFSRLFS